MQAMNPHKKAFCDQANDMVWRWLNARLVQRSAKPLPKATKQVRLASEVPTENAEYGLVLLLMSGLVMRPHAKGAIPLLVGNGESVRDVVGSIRQLKVVDRTLTGQIVFASDTQAEKLWKDGHLDASNLVLNYLIERSTRIPKGTAFRGFDGPFLVAESWVPLSARFTV